jgi:hypothetical protein
LAIRSNDASPRTELALEDVTFDGNVAMGGTGPERGGFGQGGGLWLNYTDATANGLVLTGNTAVGGSSGGDGVHSGRADGQGGAIAFKLESDAVFERLVVSGNSSLGGNASNSIGTAGSGFGGGLYGERATSVVVWDALVRDNVAQGGDAATGGGGFGGGFMTLDSTFSLERVQILENVAQGGDGPTVKGSGGGGGGYFSDNDGASGGRTITMVNTILGGNEATLGTGGGSTSGGGGGIFLNGAQVTLTHATIAGNVLSTSPPMQGWGVVAITRAGPIPSNMTFRYGIIADHASTADAAVHVKPDSAVTFDDGLFANNNADTAGTGTYNGLGTMTSEASAVFRSPGSPDFDYHVEATSPAVGQAGASTTPLDVDGESRSAPRDLGADQSSSLIFRDGFESGNTMFWVI